MNRLKIRLPRFARRTVNLQAMAEELPDEGDRKEVERLKAYHYGCWDRGMDQGAGLPPPQYDRRR